MKKNPARTNQGGATHTHRARESYHMTQKQQILQFLKRRKSKGATNGEIMFELRITCPHKRIDELLRDGHNIEWGYRWHEPLSRWLAVYWLVEEGEG